MYGACVHVRARVCWGVRACGTHVRCDVDAVWTQAEDHQYISVRAILRLIAIVLLYVPAPQRQSTATQPHQRLAETYTTT